MKMRHLFRLFVFLAAVVSAPVAAHSQTVTFQQVTENPDNVSLNLRFAKQEIASGRLQQAASALERILLNNPNLDSIRFLYGVLLYRMDDLAGARRELMLLEGRGLSSGQEAERVRYMERIDHATSPIRILGQIAVGGRLDSNPGLVSDRIADAIVDPGTGAFFDISNPIVGMDDGIDFGFLANGFFRVEGDIEDAPGSEWFIQADGNVLEFLDVDRADSNSAGIKAGVTFLNDRLKFTPYVRANRVALQGDEFNRRWGGGASIQYRASPVFTLFANAEFLNEDFVATAFSVNNDQRDGDVFSGRIGASFRFSEKQKISFSVFAADKDSDVNPGFSYKKTGFAVNSVTLLGGGTYATLGLRYSEIEYDQPDGLTSSPFETITRRDDRLFVRGTVGAPLQTIADKLGQPFDLPDSLKDVVMQLGVSWSSVSSTSDLVEYDNLSGDILFKKKFAF